MCDKIQDTDLYLLFDLPQTCKADEVKKAYRKKALICHPDKNPDNPNAASLFHQLSLALQILTDDKARKLYDRVLNARKDAQRRHRELDSRRKKLKEDLEAREKRAERSRGVAKSNEEILQEEIDRLRKENAAFVQQENEIIRQRFQKKLHNPVAKIWDSSEHRVKIKWNAEKTDTTNGGYTQEILYKFLSKYGDIIGLVVSKKNGSAMVEFATQEGAEMAVSFEKGLIENQLRLSWVSGAPPSSTPATSCSTLVTNTDFESLVLHKLRQAEERKKLIAQLEAEDK